MIYWLGHLQYRSNLLDSRIRDKANVRRLAVLVIMPAPAWTMRELAGVILRSVHYSNLYVKIKVLPDQIYSKYFGLGPNKLN